MRIKNTVNNVQKKTLKMRRKVTARLMGYTPIRMLVKSKRALSPVISNLILIAAVISLGFIALAYARSTSINYQTQYQQTENTDVDKLKETLAFEYVFYNSNGQVQIYVINAGSITLQVDRVYLSNSPNNVTYTMKYMNGTTIEPNHTIGIGVERQIVFVSQALPSGSYTVKVTTIRGSSFAYNFVV